MTEIMRYKLSMAADARLEKWISVVCAKQIFGSAGTEGALYDSLSLQEVWTDAQRRFHLVCSEEKGGGI